MDIAKQIEEIAAGMFRQILRANTAKDAWFRSVITFSVGGEEKPLLLFGNAHGDKEDGRCTAILNPDPTLCESLSARTAYSGPVLKELVAGRCDAAVQIWVDAYRPSGGVVRGPRYKARKPMPAKFAVE